ncbi:retrovirus-related pol polyprotein from transposon TNT 1-94 [Tanacetum coccineum]
MSSIRVVYGLAASMDLEVQKLDVTTPFLHGDLEEEIYMDQLEGFKVKGKESIVWKLKKSLYGLKPALSDIWKIDKLKKELNKSIAMKDLSEAKPILGMRIS